MDREILKEAEELLKDMEEKTTSERSWEEEEVQDISSKLGLKKLSMNPHNRKK